jgi:hypothetical protein
VQNKSLEKLLKRNDKVRRVIKDGTLLLNVKVKHVKQPKLAKVKTLPKVVVACGDCDESFNIYPPTDYEDLSVDDYMEIAGVMARLEEWREVLLPLLNIDYVTTDKTKGKLLKVK